MKIKALKSFATKYGSATKGQIIEAESTKAKKLIELKFAEKTTETPVPPTPPTPPIGDEAE